MIDPETPADRGVDRLVAEHLEHAAQQSDVAALLQRVRRSRQVDGALISSAAQPDAPCCAGGAVASEVAGRRVWWNRLGERSRWSGVTWPVLAGLVLLATFLGGRQFGPLAASAAVVLRDLQSVHRSEIDRCYRVQYAPDPRYWDGSNPLEGPSHSVLWTRGDAFWSDCSIGELKLRIGRQQDGTLWVRQSPKRAVRFTADPSQLPQEVALLCAVNAMTVPRLVDEVLADFDLRADRSVASSDGAAMVVWAALKPGRSHPLISSALLEVDPENHSLTRLVLWMVRDARPRGTVSYTLLESAAGGEEQYQLQAHLDEDAEIDHHTFKKAQER